MTNYVSKKQFHRDVTDKKFAVWSQNANVNIPVSVVSQPDEDIICTKQEWTYLFRGFVDLNVVFEFVLLPFKAECLENGVVDLAVSCRTPVEGGYSVARLPGDPKPWIEASIQSAKSSFSTGKSWEIKLRVERSSHFAWLVKWTKIIEASIQSAKSAISTGKSWESWGLNLSFSFTVLI